MMRLRLALAFATDPFRGHRPFLPRKSGAEDTPPGRCE